jgi:dUTP pyrophosphatase
MRSNMDFKKLRNLFLSGDSEEFDKGIEELSSSFSFRGVPKIKLNFINKSKNQDPTFTKDGDSGFDLRADLNTDVLIESGDFDIIPTGLFFEIPKGFEIQIRSRSGLAAKHGVAVLNSPGTIDSGYIGEIKIILINHSKSDYLVQNGDRIAQAVYASVLAGNIIELTPVDEIHNSSERGVTGFGSSGVK